MPGLSEAGRVAFPLFALVMAYNLAQPGADAVKSVRRLDTWGLIAQPIHALAFGYWPQLNILLTFALCAAAIYRSASMGCAGIRRGGAAGIRGLPVARGRVCVAGVAGLPSGPVLAAGPGARGDLLVQRQPVGAGGDPGGVGPVSGGVGGSAWPVGLLRLLRTTPGLHFSGKIAWHMANLEPSQLSSQQRERLDLNCQGGRNV